MGNVRFTSNITQWTVKTAAKLDVGILAMATDIHRVASMLAPKDSRALVNSGRIKRNGPGNYSVIFGGGSVPYARRRHFENKKNPQTLKYLQNAGEAAKRNIGRYVVGL